MSQLALPSIQRLYERVVKTQKDIITFCEVTGLSYNMVVVIGRQYGRQEKSLHGNPTKYMADFLDIPVWQLIPYATKEHFLRADCRDDEEKNLYDTLCARFKHLEDKLEKKLVGAPVTPIL